MGEIDLSILIIEEQKAESLIKKAKIKAHDIISKAKKEAEQIIKELSKVDEKDIIKKEITEVNKLIKDIEDYYKNRMKALKERIDKEREKIVEEIIKYLLGVNNEES